MIVRFYTMFLMVILLISCGGQEGKKQALADRERTLEQREEQIASIEEEYRMLLKMRDSLRASELTPLVGDTISTYESWPDNIAGDWNSRMVCRASRCANYVIGDQRNERWRFYADSTGMRVQVVNNGQHVRVFEGKYEGERISLRILNDSDAGIGVTRQVQIDDITLNAMKGNLVLTGKNNCEAVFSVELTPSTK